MARERQGLRGVARDGRIRDVVARCFDAPGLVAPHILQGDAPADVGEQLGEGAGHRARVVAERVHEGLLGLGVHLAARRAHVGGDERQLVAVILERFGGDDGPFRLRDRVDDLLAAGVAAGVGQEHPHVGRGGRGVGDQIAGEGVAHGLQVPDDDHAGFTKERGRSDDVELSGLVGGRVDVCTLEVGVGLVGEGTQLVEGTVDEEALGPFDQHDGCQRDLGWRRRARTACCHVFLPFR